MTWSVNWDAGFSSAGKPYNWEFITRYGHISNGSGELPEKPSAPTGLISKTQTETTVTLIWTPSTGPNPIQGYTVYRNGNVLPGSVISVPFTDSGLTPDTDYIYQVSATDINGNTSALSQAITVRTASANTPVNEWKVGQWYDIGDVVSWQDKTWRCSAKHTSRAEWTPSSATTLWQAEP